MSHKDEQKDRYEDQLYYDQMKVRRRNQLYFDQIVEEDTYKEKQQKIRKKVYTPFSEQKINFEDFLAAPAGYESIFYTLYFILVPYIVGSIFLFIFIADASYVKFQFLDTKAFLIVWMIGYEIVAIISLIIIFRLFIKYDEPPQKKRRR